MRLLLFLAAQDSVPAMRKKGRIEPGARSRSRHRQSHLRESRPIFGRHPARAGQRRLRS